MEAGDDGPLESSDVEIQNSRAQDASEPHVSAVDERRQSNLSQKKSYVKSPNNNPHDKSGAADKSEYEEGEYYDSEDSYGEQQDNNQMQNQNMPQPARNIAEPASNVPQQQQNNKYQSPISPYSGVDPQS